ncbi:MAG: hypothetical protein NTV49_12925 [Kiritimatiellaeota bacterium]|nr:hypothetical protein [Kiritimatiellota bacterium]
MKVPFRVSYRRQAYGKQSYFNRQAALALVSSALVFTGCAGGGVGPAPVTGRDKVQTDERMGTRQAGAKPAAVVELAPGDDIQKALDRAGPGDTIVLKDGVYYQSLLIARGGTPGKPVTLRAAHGGAADISGENGVRHRGLRRFLFSLAEWKQSGRGDESRFRIVAVSRDAEAGG